jgi:hypothetical protein
LLVDYPLGHNIMMKKPGVIMLAGWFVLTSPFSSFGADIEGKVLDAHCEPVASVRLLAENPIGKILGTAPTDGQGDYQIKGLTAGRYDYVLDTSGTIFKSGSATSYLNDKGLRLDWKVSSTSSAVALPSEKNRKKLIACVPFELSPGVLSAASIGGSALVAGGVIGGYGAAGGFSGSPSSTAPISEPPGSASQ